VAKTMSEHRRLRFQVLVLAAQMVYAPETPTVSWNSDAEILAHTSISELLMPLRWTIMFSPATRILVGD
jgi:hypothetical protein